MKILFIVRATLFTNRGGDSIQIQKTAEYLNKIGIEVSIKLTNERINYSPFDLIHFFNIIRPADILLHIRRSNKPYVVSPIFVEYAEYDRRIRSGIAGYFFKLLSADTIEYAKVIARKIINKERIISNEYLYLGHTRSVKRILRHAELLLPNSNSEYNRLLHTYHIQKEFDVVPNAVDEIFLQQSATVTKDPKMVICVGRIEGLKNQLTLIRALNNTKYSLFVIGNISVNQMRYYEQCKKEAAANIHFLPYLPQDKLLQYYHKAKVHVLPSWFETTGLSSLEAAAMGCNIVITNKGDTREYFGDDAFYCDPSSPESVFTAVETAIHSGGNDLRKKIIERYTWKRTAEKTALAYHKVLNSM